MSEQQNEVIDFIEKENLYSNHFADQIAQNIEKSNSEKELIYNEEEEIVSSLHSSERSNVSIKLEDQDGKDAEIKSEFSNEDNKDIFIENLENILEDRSGQGNEDKLN